jgi:hypothetical protein
VKRTGINIRKSNRLHLITVTHIVAEVVYIRIYLKRILRLTLVQHKVGGEEHEQGELVALAFEAGPGNIKCQTTQTSSWY